MKVNWNCRSRNIFNVQGATVTADLRALWMWSVKPGRASIISSLSHACFHRSIIEKRRARAEGKGAGERERETRRERKIKRER